MLDLLAPSGEKVGGGAESGNTLSIGNEFPIETGSQFYGDSTIRVSYCRTFQDSSCPVFQQSGYSFAAGRLAPVRLIDRMGLAWRHFLEF